MKINEALVAFRDSVSLMIKQDMEAAGSDTSYQPTIFHYTDVKGALGILESGELWFTECAHLNDPVEIQYGLRIARALFETTAQKRSAHIPNNTAASLEEGHDSGRFGFWIFSASLSDDHLGQWRSYADDGRGVCLGFALDNLDMIQMAKPIPHTLNNMRFPVHYDETRLRINLQRYIEAGLDILALVNKKELRKEQLFALLVLNDGFYANAILSKHRAYEQEHEYRLLISGERDQLVESQHHSFRERNREIIGYLRLPVPRWRQSGVLTHIRVGPAASTVLIDQLRTTLIKLRIPLPEMDRSEIPYRSLR